MPDISFNHALFDYSPVDTGLPPATSNNNYIPLNPTPSGPQAQPDPNCLVPPPLRIHQEASSAPPDANQQIPPPPIAPVPRDVCPKCGFHFTSKLRDLKRNVTRHLELSCPFREIFVPRVQCSSAGCDRTFTREDARRTHEKNKHADEDLPRSSVGVRRRRALKRTSTPLI